MDLYGGVRPGCSPGGGGAFPAGCTRWQQGIFSSGCNVGKQQERRSVAITGYAGDIESLEMRIW